MSTFIRLIPLEMDSLDKFIEPEIDFDQKRDHLVGTMSDDLKKLFTVGRHALRTLAERNITARFGESVDERQQARTQGQELREKAILLRDLFWIAVKDEFDLWDKGSIGARRGFRIVWSDKETGDLGTLFKQLFGGESD